MTVRVVVVGTGGIARRHGEAIVGNQNAEIVGAIDIDRARAEAYAAKYGGRPYGTLSECLGGADAVYILTPPSFRRQYAVEAMETGKHVFCLKPLAIAPQDGMAISEVAEKMGVVAMTGFNQRYRLGYRRLKNAVVSGQVGKPYHLWHLVFHRVPHQDRWGRVRAYRDAARQPRRPFLSGGNRRFYRGHRDGKRAAYQRP
jgi:predicted dehydrogenase